MYPLYSSPFLLGISFSYSTVLRPLFTLTDVINGSDTLVERERGGGGDEGIIFFVEFTLFHLAPVLVARVFHLRIDGNSHHFFVPFLPQAQAKCFGFFLK